MIYRSFIFLERVSKQKEQNIWQQGITCWDDFCRAERIKGIGRRKKWQYDQMLYSAQRAIIEEKPQFFKDKMPTTEMWRLYKYFKEEACYLDIEVDSTGRIIVIGISDEYQTSFFVRGSNLDRCHIEKLLQNYKLIITFNGAAFDLPKLRKQLGIAIKLPHIDLKPLCIKLGLQGGLKRVEHSLQLRRPAHLYGNPVDLWRAFHASGDKEYLDLLLEYNREDVENLKSIMVYCYQKLSAGLMELSPGAKSKVQQNI